MLRNDTFAVLRAGTDRPWGVGVVCGYGTNCSGVAPDGRVTRFPAIGPISGDWGGGGELGGLAAWHAVRSEDGRGRKTALGARGAGILRVPNARRQLMEAIYFGRIDEERLAELAPVVFEVATGGDAVAAGVVDRQADEVVADGANRDPPAPDAGTSTSTSCSAAASSATPTHAFFDRIRDGLRAVAPTAEVRVLTAPPVVGAALIGLDGLARDEGRARRRARVP